MAVSFLLPSFLQRLASPSIRTVLLCGCGGGFDFVHGMLLYPELVRLGKQVVIGSYSFGDPRRIGGDAPVVFQDGDTVVKRVSARSTPDTYYAPEIHLASFLDATFPAMAPHSMYAYYARDFTVPLLTRLYRQLVATHSADAVIIIDGGSDSLMRGDEEGLGDPIEDCVSVTTVGSLDVPDERMLLSVGLGCDRFNHVSDAASLRAIAELTAAGAFLGALGVEPTSEAFRFYRACIEHIDARHDFRSVLSGAILAAGEGTFGRSVPPRLSERVVQGDLFLWPLMPIVWAFDPVKVVERSLLSRWIRDEQNVLACHQAVARGRAALNRIRDVENLPRHEDARGPGNPWER